MAWVDEFPGAAVVGERAEQALRAPVGVMSPLWAMFGAAASAGVAYWWMTSWVRAVNIEAFAMMPSVAIEAAPAIPSTPAAVAAEIAPPIEEAIEPVAEAVVEAVGAAEEAVKTTAASAEAVTASPAVDDLTRMVGIGPKLAAALAERGVTRFSQIAAWSADELSELDAALSLKGRAVREAWVAQAKRLAADA